MKPIALEFLQAIYCNNDLPLPTRMRAAMAALPFESPKLAVVAQVTERDFAALLDARLKRMEQAAVIDAKPPQVEVKPPLPRLPDCRFRRI